MLIYKRRQLGHILLVVKVVDETSYTIFILNFYQGAWVSSETINSYDPQTFKDIYSLFFVLLQFLSLALTNQEQPFFLHVMTNMQSCLSQYVYVNSSGLL